LTHRGAESADNVSGDGAGILIQLPHQFFIKKGISVPEEGKYGAGLVFLPSETRARKECESILIGAIKDEGLSVRDILDVKVDSRVLGDISRSTEPYINKYL
jgi:glutamate synthase (NADPH/NADH) large chain